MAVTHRTRSSTRSMVTMTGRVVNELVSFIVFCFLDLLDFILCYTFKLVDFLVEAEWKPCYCSSSAITSSAKILVSERSGESKIVCLRSMSKLQLEEISDTLYTRPSLVSQVSKSTVKRLNKVDNTTTTSTSTSTSTVIIQSSSDQKKIIKINGTVRSTFKVNSSIVEMLQGKIGGHSHPHPHPRPMTSTRWSDCDCNTCNSWASSCKDTLFVKAGGATDNNVMKEDVIFIHGFISSSAFWTETLYPNFKKSTKSKYRLLAFDLLGFGRSPKPNDSLYTLREHIEMIERCVIDEYKVKSFHIVAHSLGCILALALAVKYPGSLKSLTLLAPPYFPVPKGEQATQYMMRRVAPRRIWPLISFGASIACWYEHISRTICLLICKNHQIWEFIAKLLTRNRIRTYLMEGFWCHTHNAAWHTLHNIICGTASKIEGYLDVVQNRLNCNVTIIHGTNDELIPLECTYNLQSRVPRAQVKLVQNKDHITIVVGRQKAFARQLEQIWRNSTTDA